MDGCRHLQLQLVKCSPTQPNWVYTRNQSKLLRSPANMVKPTLFAALILVSGFNSASGLQCYECSYMTGANGRPVPGSNDSSCASGNEPNNAYLVECEEVSKSGMARVSLAPDGSLLLNRSIDTTANISPNQLKRFGCGEFIADGNVDGEKHKMTTRTCVSSYVAFPEGCSKKKLEEWRKKDSQWGLIVSMMTDPFDGSAHVTGCYCTGDKCNSVMAIVAPHSLVFFVGSTLLAMVKL